MQSTTLPRPQRLLRGFQRLKQTFHTRLNPPLRNRHGLELSELILLRCIAESAHSPSELSVELRVPAPAISRRLDALESRGLLLRKLDRGDARRRVITLTPSGDRLLDEANATLEHEVDAMLSVASDSEVEQFVGVLEKITAGAGEGA